MMDEHISVPSTEQLIGQFNALVMTCRRRASLQDLATLLCKVITLQGEIIKALDEHTRTPFTKAHEGRRH